MATVGRIHDGLAAAGFTVLSYDRLGVGFSDANTSGEPQTVDEVVADMHAVLQRFVKPDSQRWGECRDGRGACDV
jgi:pimeloyl-ACP methyl ester carboxylesterase